MNWVIVAMVLVDVALIAFGVYRLTRTTVRPGLMGRMFSAGMLTSAEPPGLLPPSEHDVLQYRRLQVIAFETLGGGICGLILLSVCATLGHAVPLPYSPWTADSRTLVTMLFGSAGDVVGLTLGSRFGRILGRARVFRAVPNMLTGDVEMPRYVDLISRRLRVTLWIIPLANAALVVALVVLVTLQTGMGPSRAVSALWPLAVLPLLFISYALAMDLVGRQRYIPLGPFLSGPIADFGHDADLRSMFDPSSITSLMIIQMLLAHTIVIPLSHSGDAQPAILALSFSPILLAAISGVVMSALLPGGSIDIPPAVRSFWSHLPRPSLWR